MPLRFAHPHLGYRPEVVRGCGWTLGLWDCVAYCAGVLCGGYFFIYGKKNSIVLKINSPVYWAVSIGLLSGGKGPLSLKIKIECFPTLRQI